ncbi:VOC family protein [Salegentibacter salarius]|uniref:Glyoxalase n=1 Tax=Salegentibacter salarius TaxID=435906 RepID=A0A2N0TXR0_9FLAO|nr:VOC family protein [Salegentibacter salarius]OEY73201.1 glyoxalase [Salegentibacter salarius]PKD19533.1 glyoxalase [Salegentibacter salarius]SLJ98727.1 Catechol-2,3-dioxygenase [Salegentibacter salarius]
MKIHKLQIYSDNLKEQLRFYRDTLNLKITDNSDDYFEVETGYSTLRCQQKENATAYHIAFHIPDNQHKEALEWVKERVPVLRGNGQEIVDFMAWSAKSLYFYDKDKNIIEFISRESFSKPGSALFSEKSILGISEVGLVTENITEKFNFLNANFELEKYDGDFEHFCAIGDDEGLLITINQKLKDWFPTDDKAFKSEFKIEFSHQEKQHSLIFEDDQLKAQQ